MEKYTFQEFEDVSYEEWKRFAEKTLKGTSLDSIFTHTYENITLKPLYTKEDTQSARVTQAASLFPIYRDTIAQEIGGNSLDETNRKVLQAIAHGQSILHVLLDKATRQGKDSDMALPNEVLQAGVPINCVSDFEYVLQGIRLEKYPFLLYTGHWAMPMLAIAAAYRKQSGSSFSGTIGADPLGCLAEEGHIPFTLQQSFDAMAGTIKWTKQHMPTVRTIFIRTDGYHNAGANAVQELAAALATAVQYVREGIKRGVTADEMCRHMTFSFSVGTQLFMEIAKLRAIRVLWKKAAESFGAKETTLHLHTRTSKRTKTLYDHHVNLLRATTEAFSAIVGGTDTLHVSTYNEVYSISEENSERWARNIQHILCGESHLSKVLDPASGSYYVETLTEQLAEKAWKLFQQIEAKGGMSASLQQGWLQTSIAETAKQRYRRITALEQKLVGTNVYVKQDELRQIEEYGQLVEKVQRRVSEMIAYKEQRLLKEPMRQDLPLHHEQTLNELVHACSIGTTIGEMTALFTGAGENIVPIRAMRDAEPFERLRGATEKYMERTGVRPHALLVQLAKAAKSQGLSTVMKTMLEACGYYVSAERNTANIATLTRVETAALFLEGDLGTVKETVTNIVQAGYSGHVFIIGKFSEEEKQLLVENGVSGFLQEADEVLPLLYELQNQLEVTV